MNDISTEIKTRREALGLTQSELAHLSGVPQAGISRIEGGSSPSIDTLTRLADVLGKFTVPTVYEWHTTCPERTCVVYVMVEGKQHRAVYLDDVAVFITGDKTLTMWDIEKWREQV